MNAEIYPLFNIIILQLQNQMIKIATVCPLQIENIYFSRDANSSEM